MGVAFNMLHVVLCRQASVAIVLEEGNRMTVGFILSLFRGFRSIKSSAIGYPDIVFVNHSVLAL